MDEERKLETLRRRPLPPAAVETLAMMADEGMILLISSAHSDRDPHFLSMGSLARRVPRDLPFVLSAAAFQALWRRGYISRASRQKLEERLQETGASLGRKAPLRVGEAYLAWHEEGYVLTRDGRAALDNLRGQLADIRSSREAAVEAPRLVVAARLDYSGSAGWRMKRRPGAGRLYRVTRETEARFYVDDPPPGISGETQGTSVYDPAVKGAPPGRYIEKSDVFMADVTPEQYSALRRATAEFDESDGRAASQADAEIAEIRRRYTARRDQMIARLEDEIRESMRHESGTPPQTRR